MESRLSEAKRVMGRSPVAEGFPSSCRSVRDSSTPMSSESFTATSSPKTSCSSRNPRGRSGVRAGRHGLRTRETAPRRPRAGQAHRHRHRARHAGVHEPRADTREAARRTQRCLRSGDSRLRAVHGSASLQREIGAGDDDRPSARVAPPPARRCARSSPPSSRWRSSAGWPWIPPNATQNP